MKNRTIQLQLVLLMVVSSLFTATLCFASDTDTGNKVWSNTSATAIFSEESGGGPLFLLNNPPVANNDVGLSAGNAVTVNVLDNDSDFDGDAIYVCEVGNPIHGTAVLNADGSITYTPPPGYEAGDNFTYTVCDGEGGSDIAIVYIGGVPQSGVGFNYDGPIGVNDYVFAAPYSTVIDVLDNDYHTSGLDIFVCSTDKEDTSGSVYLNGDGTLTYIPDEGFSGDDSFTYFICDGNGAIDTAMVYISNIVSTNQNFPPVVIDDVEISYGGPVTVQVIKNDYDPDGGLLTICGTTPPANGTIEITPQNYIVYTPNPGFIGDDFFTYIMCDNQGGSGVGQVTVQVLDSSVNNAPVAGTDVGPSAGNPVTVNVLANDTDVDGDILSICATTSPINGSIMVNADGSITYIPNPGYNAGDNFTYTVCDGNGNSDIGLVYIGGVPESGVGIFYDGVVAITDYVNAGTYSTVIDVLENDFHTEGLDLFVCSTDKEDTSGSVFLNGDGTLTYIPDEGFSGDDSFTYFVCDGNGDIDTATVFISGIVYTTQNFPPVVIDDVEISYGGPVTVQVIKNDYDPDGGLLSICGTSSPANGTIEVTPQNYIVYTPNIGFLGTDCFTYTMCDGQGGSDIAEVCVNVLDCLENNNPLANDDDVSSVGDEITVYVLANDSDFDGDDLYICGTTNPINGSLLVNTDGSITYTPNPGYTSMDNFTYTVCDGNGNSDIGIVNISGIVSESIGSVLDEEEIGSIIFGGIVANNIQQYNNTERIVAANSNVVSKNNSTNSLANDILLTIEQLSPVPSSTNLTVKYTATEMPVQLEIYSVIGTLVSSQKYTATNGINVVDVDVSKFANGIYTLVLQAENGLIVTQKFVKQ